MQELIHVSRIRSRLSSLKEYDEASATSVYGTTKLLVKTILRVCSKYYIVRTLWLYGYVGNDFVYTMMKLAANNESINVVNDQREILQMQMT